MNEISQLKAEFEHCDLTITTLRADLACSWAARDDLRELLHECHNLRYKATQRAANLELDCDAMLKRVEAAEGLARTLEEVSTLPLDHSDGELSKALVWIGEALAAWRAADEG